VPGAYAGCTESVLGALGSIGCLWSALGVSSIAPGLARITDPSTNSAPILFALSSTWLDTAVTVSVA
jgi:hypothetical protein